MIEAWLLKTASANVFNSIHLRSSSLVLIQSTIPFLAEANPPMSEWMNWKPDSPPFRPPISAE